VDVIRAYSPFVPGAAAVLAGRLTGRPSIVAVHTDSEEVLSRLDPAAARVLGALERFALSRADRVWCVTEYLRATAVARGVRPQRIRIAPNRVPVGAFASPDAAREADTRARWAIPPGAPVVVAVGRLDLEKDPLTLVRAFALAGHPEARLVLVGDGGLRRSVEQEGIRAGLDGRLVLTGFRPRDEVASFLHLAACFVLASRYEGFPHALVEALAAGVPVVASDAPQLDELLAGTGAARFPVGDAGALAARLREVLADPAASRISSAAGRAGAARYELSRVDAAEAELYRELLRGPVLEVGGRR
jgi:glycosyltransferase involved in cell wall biosynthesis